MTPIDVDWTTLLIALGTYAIGHAAGCVQMWLRLRHDAALGRSMRPRPRTQDDETEPQRARRRR